MDFTYVHTGYYIATSDLTGESYVVRTRPLNDGWMAINDSDGIVLDTGLSFTDAKGVCEYDAQFTARIEQVIAHKEGK